MSHKCHDPHNPMQLSSVGVHYLYLAMFWPNIMLQWNLRDSAWNISRHVERWGVQILAVRVRLSADVLDMANALTKFINGHWPSSAILHGPQRTCFCDWPPFALVTRSLQGLFRLHEGHPWLFRVSTAQELTSGVTSCASRPLCLSLFVVPTLSRLAPKGIWTKNEKKCWVVLPCSSICVQSYRICLWDWHGQK